jgi:hypothetical protein
MSRISNIAHRVAAFLDKHNAAYCENCLVERLLIASRTAMRAALESERFNIRIGVCPDCRTRKQVVGSRARTSSTSNTGSSRAA